MDNDIETVKYDGKTYYTEQGIKECFKQHTMQYYYFDADEAEIAVSDFPDFYLPYLRWKKLRDETIGGSEAEVFAFWTDFSMMMMEYEPPFTFYWYAVYNSSPDGPQEDLFRVGVTKKDMAYHRTTR